MLNNVVDFLETIQSFLGDLTIIILFIIFIYIFGSEIKSICKLAKMVLDIYISEDKEHIITHIRFLLKTKGEFTKRVTSFEYIGSWYRNQVEKIIFKYTNKTQEKQKYGVVKQSSSRYYVDLQKACVEDKEKLDALAFSLALEIVNKIDIYSKKRYTIVGQSEGNVILANKVANILGLDFLIVGNLAGKKDDIFGNINGTNGAIIVDDILFTGTMLIKNIKTLRTHKVECESVVVVLRRSLLYQKPLSEYANQCSIDIPVFSLFTYLDNDFDEKCIC